MTESEDIPSQISSLKARVEAVEAVLAIQALKASYGDLVDRRYSAGAVLPPHELDQVVGAIVDLFTEDATWDGGPVLGVAHGRDAIAARLSNPTLVFSRHVFAKPHIAVEGSRATGRWDLLCPCRTADGRSWWMCGFEDDTYRQKDGTWLHTSMRLTTVFMAPAGEGFERILA